MPIWWIKKELIIKCIFGGKTICIVIWERYRPTAKSSYNGIDKVICDLKLNLKTFKINEIIIHL